ncbi:MAG: hypothetical protein Hyperionvirus11_40 [Hyperionvirus sp.]|uniref:Uncharacterized protein n=1 Tax=Hyperionvirus sp. TaxID=2487770 RepID=A0A3G5A929_9VIRU|nr:MAG: hypothetical protein Hyperionvirus11_40 [Hyperionvirus sp.]
MEEGKEHELARKCDELSGKVEECSKVVRKLRGEAEESELKSALGEAEKKLKDYVMEYRISPLIIEAKAAIRQWVSSHGRDRTIAAERYYEAIGPIINENRSLVPILPLSDHRDIIGLIHLIFPWQVHTITISREFDEKHFCLTIKENGMGAIDDDLIRKIIGSFGIFDEVAVVCAEIHDAREIDGGPWYHEREFIAMEKGSKYSRLPGGAWIDKAHFNFSRKAVKCDKCDKWIFKCSYCKSESILMYNDCYGAVCADSPECQKRLGYVGISDKFVQKKSDGRACQWESIMSF